MQMPGSSAGKRIKTRLTASVPPVDAPTATLSANPTKIIAGQSITLSPSFAGGTGVISFEEGSVAIAPLNGITSGASVPFTPDTPGTITCTLTVTNTAGTTATGTVSVTVQADRVSPVIQLLSQLPDGNMEVRASGIPGETYKIQAAAGMSEAAFLRHRQVAAMNVTLADNTAAKAAAPTAFRAAAMS